MTVDSIKSPSAPPPLHVDSLLLLWLPACRRRMERLHLRVEECLIRGRDIFLNIHVKDSLIKI